MYSIVFGERVEVLNLIIFILSQIFEKLAEFKKIINRKISGILNLIKLILNKIIDLLNYFRVKIKYYYNSKYFYQIKS